MLKGGGKNAIIYPTWTGCIALIHRYTEALTVGTVGAFLFQQTEAEPARVGDEHIRDKERDDEGDQDKDQLISHPDSLIPTQDLRLSGIGLRLRSCCGVAFLEQELAQPVQFSLIGGVALFQFFDLAGGFPELQLGLIGAVQIADALRDAFQDFARADSEFIEQNPICAAARDIDDPIMLRIMDQM